MKIIHSIFTPLWVLLSLSGCIGGGDTTTQSQSVARGYVPPSVPAIFTTDGERSQFMVENYWRNFDFRDTTLVSSRVTEQSFVGYLSVLRSVPLTSARRGVERLMESASVDSLVYRDFIAISERYLYDPNSQFRNEELYISVLESILESSALDELSKMRPEHQLQLALKNRVGERAADFEVRCDDGRRVRLSQMSSRYTILLFNNPDCNDCARVKEFIVEHREIFERATILSVYVDEDLELWRGAQYPDWWINGYDEGMVLTNTQLYDLKAIPTLYLLDSEQRVILKDAPVEYVGQFLYQQQSVQ